MTNEEAIKWFRGSPAYHKDHEPYNMAIKALETLEEFERAQIIIGGRLNGRALAYKCGLEDGKRKALDKEPCEDAISRKEAMVSIRALYPGMPRADLTGHRRLEWSRKNSQYIECEKAIMALPPVTPIRPKGEWIVREDNTSFVRQIPRRWVECSHCGWSFSYDRIKDDFCSKCGADMKGKKE